MTRLLALVLCAAAAAPSWAAVAKDPAKVDLDALADETQKSTKCEGATNLVWWIPLEYWKATFRQSKDVGAEQAEQMIRSLEPYMIVCVVRARMSDVGTVHPLDEGTVRRNLTVTYVDARGQQRVLTPLAKVEGDVANIVEIIKPILKNVLGSFGESFRFFIISDRDAAGARLASPYQKGKLVVELKKVAGDEGGTVEIDCPLNSLFVPRQCAKCRKEAHVSWNFCPWCGLALPR